MPCTPSDFRRLALALPQTEQRQHMNHPDFRVAGKIFATMPLDERRVHVLVDEAEVRAYCAEFPGTVEELWWGKKLSGCRVELAGATAPLLRELLTEAWRRRAPKAVRDRFDG